MKFHKIHTRQQPLEATEVSLKMTKFFVLSLALLGYFQALSATPVQEQAPSPTFLDFQKVPPPKPLRTHTLDPALELSIPPVMKNNTNDPTVREDLCRCGQSTLQSTRIVGGVYAYPGEFPWRVYINVGDWRRGSSCGATVLNSRWLMTAAHCFDRMKSGDFVMVHVGNVNYEKGHRIMSNRHIIHEGYRVPHQYANDIALIELSEELDMSNPLKISPICLPYRYIGNSEASGNAVASGWGNIDFGVDSPDSYMRKVGVKALATSECQYLHKNVYYTGVTITTNQTCTILAAGNTCQGDSGGSIDAYDNGKFTAVGIVSYGVKCRMGVYTRVSEYIDWIELKTGIRNFCKS